MSLGNSTVNIISSDEEITDKVKPQENLNWFNSRLQDWQRLLENLERHKNVISNCIKLIVYGLLLSYFIWATHYFITKEVLTLNSTTCNGYGFLMILYIFGIYGFAHKLLIKPKILPVFKKFFWTPFKVTFKKHLRNVYFRIFIYVIVLLVIVAYLIWDTSDNRQRLIPIVGLFAFILFGLLFSKYPGQVKWRPVLLGLLLQFFFGLFTIRWSVGRNIFGCMGDKITNFLSYAINGSAFVYGPDLVYEQSLFAFAAIVAIYFLAFVINILYYYGIMQRVVLSLGLILKNLMGTSICESVNSAANIFLGQTEAPFLLAPYLSDLTDSEIHSIITSGFATVSGSVFAAYVSYGAKAEHLITASVMSAPAALCFSKLFLPETEETKATKESIKIEKSPYKSALEAGSAGASQATQAVFGIIANVIAFLASIYFINGVLAWMGGLVGYTDQVWSLDKFVGYLFTPITFIMGVPWDECEQVGKLIGLKTMVNEFVAFEAMGRMELRPRTKVIATYALCGFANPGSVGIMISTLGTLMPKKIDVVTNNIMRAFISGSCVCFMTACIAALSIPDSLIDI